MCNIDARVSRRRFVAIASLVAGSAVLAKTTGTLAAEAARRETANARGRYTHPSDPNTQLALDPNFEGYAELRTDADGGYAITTIKPGPYPTARGDLRAPHIQFEVHGTTDRKVSQVFFPGEPLNEQDRHLNSVRRTETVIANVTSRADALLVASWDIVLTTG